MFRKLFEGLFPRVDISKSERAALDMAMERRALYRRICEMSGVDENGCIIPPPDGMKIDRSPPTYWKMREYPDTKEAPPPLGSGADQGSAARR